MERLRESLIKSKEEIESKGVEDSVKSTDNPDDAVKLIKKTERIIKSKKNNILTLAYQQGIILRKFKENNKFITAVTEFKVSKATITKNNYC